jgi:hypothetical protein
MSHDFTAQRMKTGLHVVVFAFCIDCIPVYFSVKAMSSCPTSFWSHVLEFLTLFLATKDSAGNYLFQYWSHLPEKLPILLTKSFLDDYLLYPFERAEE